MDATRLHYFFAQNWPYWIWIVAVPSSAMLLMAWALGAPPTLFSAQADSRTYLFLLLAAGVIGLLVAGLIGVFVLGPLYRSRAGKNGAPFQRGDRVKILVGPNRGRVVRVTEVREMRGTLSVDPEGLKNPKGKTAFEFTQLIRADEAEPDSRADSAGRQAS